MKKCNQVANYNKTNMEDTTMEDTTMEKEITITIDASLVQNAEIKRLRKQLHNLRNTARRLQADKLELEKRVKMLEMANKGWEADMKGTMEALEDEKKRANTAETDVAKLVDMMLRIKLAVDETYADMKADTTTKSVDNCN